ncbi:PBP1A family penicillin-binding protein [Streptococcus sp. X16XC17]|uniref:penicillin-binding protein PBP1A n=1 Tax=Streptococcus sp. X16XC17 TaxID=2316646 RepID=UPI00103C8F83|nr:penicillin-binding protein PBP1A [Streptococcus sp. X16XC17]TCD45632.1 PBP1A family penicillin-binding protein [Streptococcus sp. X16XC17]
MKNLNLKRILLIAGNIFLIGFIVAVIAGVGLVFYYVQSAPKLTEKSLTATTSSKIYDKDGNLIADLGSEKRSNAETSEIPTDLVNAIVSIEDQRFFNHRGLDVVRIAGAFINNLTSGNLQGGSTLDQQFIKLTYFSTSTQDQTLKRKIQEAWLATQLERRNTKQEILTYYVNKVYMSNGNYGMKTAANAYYGKELKDLSLAQQALLAGMPQAPNQYDPYIQPEAAKQRRDLVLGQMLEEKYISQEAYDMAVATPITDGLQSLKQGAAYPAYMDNYLKEVIEEVEAKTGYNLLTTGMEVYTNVDAAAQKQLWDIYNTTDYVNYPDDTLQIASTVVDVHTGKVVAQLGARNQASSVSFGTNQAVETNRDFGSTMKPLTDYAPALENGVYTSTADTVYDGPYNFPGTTDPVHNWDHGYYGTITLKTALQYSRNIPAVKALEATGLDKSLAFLNSVGINYPQLLFSNAISSNTTESNQHYGASSEKMAAAYAAFANGGTYYAPQYVNKIVYTDGTTTDFTTEGKRVMTEETAYMMTDMLKSVMTYGNGLNGAVDGVPQAGKTGTSNYTDPEIERILQENEAANSSLMVVPDENFVGYSTKYAMAVWTGYTNRSTPVLDDGMLVATDVYRNMMAYLNPIETATDWEIPDGLVQSGNYLYLKGFAPQYSYNYNTPASSSQSTTQSSSTTTGSTATETSTTTQATPNQTNTQTSTEQSTTNSSSAQTPATGQ